MHIPRWKKLQKNICKKEEKRKTSKHEKIIKRSSYADGVVVDDGEGSWVTVDIALQIAWRLRLRALCWVFLTRVECCRSRHGNQVTSAAATDVMRKKTFYRILNNITNHSACKLGRPNFIVTFHAQAEDDLTGYITSSHLLGLANDFCIGLSRYIAITNLSIIAVFVEYLRQFLIDLHQIYRHSSAPQNTSPWIFLSILAPAVSEHGAAATFFRKSCACHGVANPLTASR